MVPADTASSLLGAPIWLDVTAIIVSALGGALFAARRPVPLTGVLLIAIATGLGGGIVRDLLLAEGPPRAISDPAYLPAAFWAAIVGMLIVRMTHRIAAVLLVLDALAAGLFSVVGVERTLAAGYPWASAILIGVIAAAAGGIIRDLLAGEPPSMMTEGPWDASAALVGSAVMVLLVTVLDVPVQYVEWPIVLAIGAMAVLSVRFGWRAPMAADVSPILDRPIDAVKGRVVRRPRPADAAAGVLAVDPDAGVDPGSSVDLRTDPTDDPASQPEEPPA